MSVKITNWDPVDHLDGPEAIAAYLDAALELGDPAVIAATLGDVARARGMTRMARETGVTREALYRALSPDGHPEFNTVVKVMRAFGLRFSPVPVKAVKTSRTSRLSTSKRLSAASAAGSRRQVRG